MPGEKTKTRCSGQIIGAAPVTRTHGISLAHMVVVSFEHLSQMKREGVGMVNNSHSSELGLQFMICRLQKEHF